MSSRYLSVPRQFAPENAKARGAAARADQCAALPESSPLIKRPLVSAAPCHYGPQVHSNETTEAGILQTVRRAVAARPLPTFANLRLAAIDLDGTLLGPDLTISAENRRAVARLRAAGLEVVVASGRHHASIRPYAAQLPDVRWVVSVQGGEVSDVARATVLSQRFIARAHLETARLLQTELGITGLFYAPDRILTSTTAQTDVEFYARLTGLHPVRVPGGDLSQGEIFKIVWVGSPAALDAIAVHPRVAALGLQTVRTHQRLFELLPIAVTKATGLAVLAAHLGLTARDVVVFGDADNDIPMFDWAGASFAMPHGWPAALPRAHWIAPAGPAESAFARAVDMIG